MVPSVHPSQFKSFCDEKQPFLLDVRTHFEFTDGHLENAVNIPIQFLSGSMGEIPEDRPVLVYCLHGVRSAKAAHFLILKGLQDVYHLEGGLSELE